MTTSLTHYAKKLPVLKHVKTFGTHVKKHHKKYLWGAAGIVGLIKLFTFLIVGLSGYLVTQAAFMGATTITDPAAGSIQTSPGFYVTFYDEPSMGALDQCFYTVIDYGDTIISNSSRACNSEIWINLPGACSNGTNTCRVEGYNIDTDGNQSNNFNNYRLFSISVSTIVDTTPPTGGDFVINLDAATTYSTGVLLKTICATDPSGVRVAFGNTPSPDNRQTCSTTMAHTLLSGDGLKTVYMRFQDGGDNRTTDITDTITLSTTTYEYNFSMVSVNTNTPVSGVWLSASSVPFSWTLANASLIGGYHTFTIDSNNTTEGLNNGTYSETRTLADGLHTRGLSFSDGEAIDGLSETFYVDTLNPTGTIVINAGAPIITTAVATLTLSGHDANGISGMQFSCNNSTWSTVEAYVATKSFNITNYAGAGCTTSEGTKTIYVKYQDKSSKRSTSTIIDTIIYDITAPSVPTLSCTNFTGNVVSNYTGTTTCTINNTAAPSPVVSVVYSINSGLTWTDIGNSNLSFTFIPAEGTTNVIMGITDYGGGPTNSNTYVIIKDTTASTITIVNPSTAPAVSKTVTASTVGTLTMTTGSTSTICNATRTFIPYASTTFTSEADNGKYICYSVVDLAGNTGYALSNAIAGIDTTAPVTPTMVAEPTYTSGTSNTVNASTLGEAGLLYQFCINTSNSTGICSMIGESPSTVASHTFSSLSEIRYYYFVRVSDAIGNRSNWSTGTSSTQDATIPMTAITSPTSGSIQTGNFTVHFGDYDSISLGIGCAYKIENNGASTLGWTGRSCSQAGVDILINQALYCPSNGTCMVYSVSSDAAGNLSTIADRLFIIDTTIHDVTAPVLAQVTAIPSPTNDTTPSYTFSSSEAGTTTYGGSCIPSLDVNAISGNNTVTFTTLADGTYNNCTVTVTDAAGNASNALAINTFTINTTIADTTAPTTTITSPLASSRQSGNFVVSFTDSDNVALSGCEYSIAPSVTTWNTRSCNSGVIINLASVCSTQGLNTCVVYGRSTDSTGNISTSAIRPFSIDSIAPTAPTLSCTTFTNNVISNYTGATTCSINSTAAPSPVVSVEYSTDGGSYWANLGNSSPSFTFIPATGTTNVIMRITDYGGGPTNSNTFIIIKDTTIPDTTKPTCTISYLPLSATNQNVSATCTPSETVTFQSPVNTGIYTFIVNGSYTFEFTDTAGNTGTATATVSWIDKTAPTLTQITAVPTPTTSTTPSYTFYSSEAGTITYGGYCSSVTTAAVLGNTTITFNALATGTYTNCTITVTDAVGNVSSPLAISGFTIGTTALTAPVLSTLSGDSLCPSLPILFTRTASTNSDFLITGSQLSGYSYEVYNNSGMLTTGIVLSGTTTSTGVSLALSVLPLGTYYMRVQAINALGTSTASNTISFVLSSQYCSTRGTGIVISTPILSLRNLDLDTIYRSDPILVLGFTGAVPISISKGMLFINNTIGTGSGTTGTITSNDTVYIEMVSSDIYDTTVTSILTVLGHTGTFSLTTKKKSCTLSITEKIIIQNIYSSIKDEYNNDLSKLADFLTTFQNMVQDEANLSDNCNLDYLLALIEDDLSQGGIDTSDHITPNCKEYTVEYDSTQKAYFAPEMTNKYYFINRESLIRHLDYYNPGDCHINTYEDNVRDATSDSMIHAAPNGKLYTLVGQYGGFSANEFITPKYFDSLENIVRYIDIKNPPKELWNHTVDTSFTPTVYMAPNSKSYTIYKTDRGYMSYKLMQVKYYATITELKNYINTNNPSQ